MPIFKRKKEKKEEKKREKKKGGLKEALKGTFYGMAVHGAVTAMLKTRMYMEHLFMLMTIGDMLGFPIIPPYYSLKILPYVVPQIESWKRRLFRERDFTDLISG